MANGSTTNGSNGSALNWWATYVVAPILVLGVLGLSAWAVAAQSTLQVHETRISWHERQADRMEAKLDRILERLEDRQ
jgi:hypothetical protein